MKVATLVELSAVSTVVPMVETWADWRADWMADLWDLFNQNILNFIC